MKMFYEEPSLSVRQFAEENVVTAVSGVSYSTNLTSAEKTTLEEKYSVYTLSAASLVF